MTDSSSASDGNLTDRLRLFGAVALGVSVLGCVVHAVSVLVLAGPHLLFTRAMYVQLAGCLFPLGVWLLSQRPRSATFCRAIEAMGLIGAAASLTLMAQFLAESMPDLTGAPRDAIGVAFETNQQRFSAIAVHATAMVYLLRAALVPSRPGRTAALGLGIGAVILLGPLFPFYEAPLGRRLVGAVATFALWVLAVAVGTTLSWVIHGLRREIAKARRLGQYTLGDKLGEGGMGTVYAATHALLRRPTAIKLLQESRAGDLAIKRFEREVQVTAQLKHPHTITIYDYGRTPDGVFYYAMDLLEGRTVQTIVDKDGAQSAERAVHVMRSVAGALQEAHGRGLIHRDIKPANIMLGDRGGIPDFATVLDFGLVRDIDDKASPELTTVGAVVGTPMYLAPELIKGNPATPRSDIYALGGVGYFMVTGKHVFEGDTVVEVCAHHLHTPVTPPSARLGKPVHPGLEKLLMQCLAKNAEDRPGNAKELERALLGLGIALAPAL